MRSRSVASRTLPWRPGPSGRAPRSRTRGRRPQLFQGAGELSTDFDFSSDATLRSIDESLGRLGLDRVDVVLIHDPEDHLDEAVSGAYQALDRLRAEGTVRAIGAGMNWPAPMAELVRRTDLDCVLLAGRYSLLEHGALDELFPLLERRGIGALIGGALNSGVLADPRPGATFHYAEAPTQVLQRARAIEQLCSSHGVPLAAAALQFPLGHPVVTAVVCGARTPGEASQNAELVTMDIPPGLWEELIGTHHLPVGVPIG